jgi:hypothetical protein
MNSVRNYICTKEGPRERNTQMRECNNFYDCYNTKTEEVTHEAYINWDPVTRYDITDPGELL